MPVNFNLQFIDLLVQILSLLIDLLDSLLNILSLSCLHQLKQVSLLSTFVVLKGILRGSKTFTHLFENAFLIGWVLRLLDSLHVVFTHLLETRVLLFLNFADSGSHFSLTFAFHAL